MKHIFLFALISLSLNGLGFSATYEVDTKSSAVTFKATGNPGFIRINGTGGKLSGKLDYSDTKFALNGLLTVEMKDLTTDMTLRDRHMREKYLEIEKFPQATLKFSDSAFTMKADGFTAEVKADLTLHGVTKPVKVVATISKPLSEKPHIEASMPLVLSDFNIEIPSFATVTVAKDVDVNIEFDAARIGEKK